MSTSDAYWSAWEQAHGQTSKAFSQSADDESQNSTTGATGNAHRASSHGHRNSGGQDDSFKDHQSSSSQRKPGDEAKANRTSPIEEKDPYRLFGVPRNADHSTVRWAWRRALQQTHPDRSKAIDATQHTQRINQAYDSIRREKGWEKAVVSV